VTTSSTLRSSSAWASRSVSPTVTLRTTVCGHGHQDRRREGRGPRGHQLPSEGPGQAAGSMSSWPTRARKALSRRFLVLFTRTISFCARMIPYRLAVAAGGSSVSLHITCFPVNEPGHHASFVGFSGTGSGMGQTGCSSYLQPSRQVTPGSYGHQSREASVRHYVPGIRTPGGCIGAGQGPGVRDRPYRELGDHGRCLLLRNILSVLSLPPSNLNRSTI